MKVIQVNQTQKHRASKKHDLKMQRFISLIIKQSVEHFSKIRLKNSYLLNEKNEITVVLLDAKDMKKINFKFRHKNKPTDVLSFASADSNSLGELLLCLEVLENQAVQQKHSLQHEIAYMLIHGLLHLFGYDHEASKQEERLMFRLQDKCFENLGLV